MTIDARIDAAEAQVRLSLNKAFGRLDRMANDLVSQLDQDNGLLVRDIANTNKANNLLKELRQQMTIEQRKIYDTEIKGLQDMLREVIKESEDVGIPKSFTDITQAEAKAFMRTNIANLQDKFNSALNEVDDLVKSSISGTLDFREATAAISRRIQVTIPQAESLASSALMNFQSTIMTTHAEEHGVVWFAYEGPHLGGNIREYCFRMVGNRFTTQQLESTAGKYGRDPSLVPVTTWRGGYRCRHRLIPLVDPKDIKRYPIGPKG